MIFNLLKCSHLYFEKDKRIVFHKFAHMVADCLQSFITEFLKRLWMASAPKLHMAYLLALSQSQRADMSFKYLQNRTIETNTHTKKTPKTV